MRPPLNLPPPTGTPTTYHRGQALEPRTMPNPEVTAGMTPTPAFGMFFNQVLRPEPETPAPVRPRWWDDAHRLFTVIGMVAAVAILFGIGLYAVVQVACPCTFGGMPTQPEPTPTINVNASQYDPAGTCGTEGIP